MTTVTLPPPRPSSGHQSIPGARLQVIGDIPIDLAKVPPGTRIEGRVLSVDPEGHVTIQTAGGALAAKPSIALREGDVLALVAQGRPPRLQLQISAFGGTGSSHSKSQKPNTEAVPGERSPIVADRVTPFAGAARSGVSQGLPALTVGETITATWHRPTPWVTSGAAAQPKANVAANPAASIAGNDLSVAPTGSRIVGRVVSVQTSPTGSNGAGLSSLPKSMTLGPGQTIGGMVVGTTPEGQPMLRTAAGILSLATATALSKGSIVTLEIMRSPAPPLASLENSSPSIVPGWTLGSSDWPAMKAALHALHASDPAAAQNMIESVLPGPNPRFAAQTLFFLWALRGGNVQGWLGDSVSRALKRTGPELFSQISDDFRTMGRATSDATSNDWRMAHVPLSAGSEIEPIRLLIRRHGGNKVNNTNDKQDVRFIVDVSLSRLGRVQFDGLVRRNGKRLDLMIRSERSLPPRIREDIRALFREASALVDLAGEVGFRAGPDGLVDAGAGDPLTSRAGLTV
jgi:hypothetical protein